MTLWRIHPAADPGDSRWQDRRIWAEIIVRADGSALALRAASKFDRPPGSPQQGNESGSLEPGFDDEKLYWVEQLDPAEAARYADAPDRSGVIVARPLRDGAAV